MLAIIMATSYSCDNSDDETSNKKLSLSNSNSRSFIDIQKKYGAALEITSFDSSNQTRITLPGGTIINVPFGALTNGSDTYDGKVHIMSREFTSLADLTFSNMQTVDDDNNLLVSGGSYALIFLDENYNKLGIKNGFEVEVKFPAKIKNKFSENMNIYWGRLNENDNVFWTLTNKTNDYDSRYYTVKFNSNDALGMVSITNQQSVATVPCPECPPPPPPAECNCYNPNDECYTSDYCWLKRNRDLGFSLTNVDYNAFVSSGGFDNLNELRVAYNRAHRWDNIKVFAISKEYQSVIALQYNEGEGIFTTENGLYPNLGDFVLTAYTVDEPDFQYAILNTNTSLGNYQLEFQSGTQDEYYNQLLPLIE